MAKVDVENLVSCSVAADGRVICLLAKNKNGEDVEVQLPFEQVGALSMTLPYLLNRAVKLQYNDQSLRYVYHLDDFKLEGSSTSRETSILSLKTPDGFEVSFAVSVEMLPRLAATFDEEPGAVEPELALN